jgi:poly(3-hydroxyalkanoate) synthetase
MAANKIVKLSMDSDFNENWYLGVFWSEELVCNDEICIQGHFYEATNFKMAANKIVKLSMVSDFNENWYLGLFWSEELVGNDEICIQGHFYEATI